MNVLVWIVFAVLVLSIWNGYRKGFLKTAFSLVSWILVLVICNIATPMVKDMLIDQTDIQTTIQRSLDAKINEMISNAQLPEEIAGGTGFEIPENLKAAMPQAFSDMILNSVSENRFQVDTSGIAESSVGMIALFLVLIFSYVALMIINVVLGIAAKLPLIGPLDKLFGLLCGAGKGMIWSWIILMLVSVTALMGVQTEWLGYIADSQFLSFLQEHNLILNLLMK